MTTCGDADDNLFSHRYDLQCVEGGGAVCSCLQWDDDSVIHEWYDDYMPDLLCPESAFCSSTPTFNGVDCVTPNASVTGCDYCCPAGTGHVTPRGCYAPYCACNGDQKTGGDPHLWAKCNPDGTGPLPNWPPISESSQGCKAGGPWQTCAAFIYAKVDNSGNAIAVTKRGDPISNCWDVCEDFCPEFFAIIGDLSGLCNYTLDCLHAGYETFVVGSPNGGSPDKYLECKDLAPGVLAHTVDDSAQCWTNNFDTTSGWPYPSKFFRSLFAQRCGLECSGAIGFYQTTSCPADTFAGREVAALRHDMTVLAWEQGQEPPTDADVEAALRAKYATAATCQTADSAQCPIAFGCCPSSTDADELPPFC